MSRRYISGVVEGKLSNHRGRRRPSSPLSQITAKGDFFVASIKTIILSIQPKVSAVDISHFLPADSAIPIVVVLIFVFQAL